MTRRSSVLKMDAEGRRELKSWLRLNGYGSIDDAVAYAASKGFNISRSAMGRYVFHLKEQDSKVQIDPEVVGGAKGQFAELWEELLALQNRQREVMAQIQGLIGTTDSVLTAEEEKQAAG